MASERKDSLDLPSLSSSPAKMAVSIAMRGMEEDRSMSPAQLHINEMKRSMAEQKRQIEERNAKIPKMLCQQIETGMNDFENIEVMVHTLRTLQVSILRGVNLAKAALGEEPFNPRASPMPAAAAASASVPAPKAMRPPTYKSALGIPVEKPKEKDEEDNEEDDDENDEEDENDDDDENDEDDTEQNDDGFKTVSHAKPKKSIGSDAKKVNLCNHTKMGKHCHRVDCSFEHPKGYQPGPRTICSNWNIDPKKCKWGNKCKFLHAKKCPYKDGEFEEDE